MKRDQAVVVVSFGSTNHETRENAIGGIERAIEKAFPQYEVRRAFTSGFIVRRLARDGIVIDGVREALGRAEKDGIRHMVIQPTHLIQGSEYEKLLREVSVVKDRFASVAVGAPLLQDERDQKEVLDAVTEDIKEYDDGRTAVLFMGHGAGTDADAVYADLQERLVKQGFSGTYIATVEGTPSFSEVFPRIRDSRARRVILQPLMVVAGEHARNDMAGEGEDSWMSILRSEGYEVCPVFTGLGENRAIQEIYVRHVREAKPL